jgi:glycosyltransferase involved in cell wall biosynthesis
MEKLKLVKDMHKKICIVSGSDLSIPSANTIRPVYLAKGLQKIGFEVHIVVPKPSGRVPHDLTGIRVHTVPIRMSTTLGSYLINQILRAVLLVRKAKQVQKATGAILQFEHDLLGGCAALMGCRNFVLEFRDMSSKSEIYRSHRLSKILTRFIIWLEKLALSRAAKIITVSESLKGEIVKEFGVQENKVEVIPPGFSESLISHLKDRISEVEGRIAFLGTLIEDIDYDKIVGLAQSLSNNEEIYIIGDGRMRGYLEKKIKDLGLKNIVLTGWLPEKEAYKLLASSQIAILPLRDNPILDAAFPVKGMYYAALGKAIVMDDCELARELKKHNAALVSERGKPDEFIRNVHILLKNKELRLKIGINARDWAKDFTWENQAKKLAKIYETLDGDSK